MNFYGVTCGQGCGLWHNSSAVRHWKKKSYKSRGIHLKPHRSDFFTQPHFYALWSLDKDICHSLEADRWPPPNGKRCLRGRDTVHPIPNQNHNLPTRHSFNSWRIHSFNVNPPTLETIKGNQKTATPADATRVLLLPKIWAAFLLEKKPPVYPRKLEVWTDRRAKREKFRHNKTPIGEAGGREGERGNM